MILKNIIRFVILTAVQVLLLNRINFSGYIDPYLYVLFILLLPFSTPRGFLLLIAFATGAVIDIFSHTYGVHTAATVFMAFLRPGVIRMVSPRQEYENASEPKVSEMGLRWSYIYAAVLIVAHNSVLFTLEAFRFNDLIALTYRILFSSLVTLVLVLMVQYVFKGNIRS